MRRTVDLKPALDVQVVAAARDLGASISTTIADLVALGLQSKGGAAPLQRDPVSGLLGLSIGRPLSLAEAQRLTGEDD